MDNKKDRNNNIILIIAIALIIVLVGGGTMAWLSWSSENNTAVSITVSGGVLTIDGGGDITGTNLAPTTQCNHEIYSVQRPITATAVNGTTTDMMAYIQLYTNNTLFPNVYKMENLEWVISSSATDCSTASNILASGNFSNIDNSSDTSNKENTPLDLITFPVPAGQTINKTYYLYIWVNEDYVIENVGDTVTSSIQDATFTVQLTGKLMNNPSYLQAEPPVLVLDNGMIPVKLSSNGTVTTVSEDDSSWYNYSNKQWANVVLVNDSSRSSYRNTTGVTVNQDDILAYYVWIPRYKYKIPETTKCSTIPEEDRNMNDYPECYAPYTMSDEDKALFVEYYAQEENCESANEEYEAAVDYALEHGVFENPNHYSSIIDYVNSYNIGNLCGCACNEIVPDEEITLNGNFNGDTDITLWWPIDISFETASSTMETGDAVDTYRTHPAFWWDNNSNGSVDDGETVAGIWVGKFETSTESTSTCYTSTNSTNCNNANQSPRILPNVKSLRYQNVSNQFATSQKFSASGNIYGLSNISTNAHMMKNSEWGAVAYLSHSKYGINSEIRINNNEDYITGCGASEENGALTSDCEISYNSEYTPQSTTGNITGVFDMSGGADEYVMGYYSGANSNYATDPDTYFGYTSNSNYAGFSSRLDPKYWDEYTSTSSTTACNGGICYGHALSETANWHYDYAGFVNSDNPWFSRGGHLIDAYEAGAFNSNNNNGDANGFNSWRSVLACGFGA